MIKARSHIESIKYITMHNIVLANDKSITFVRSVILRFSTKDSK